MPGLGIGYGVGTSMEGIVRRWVRVTSFPQPRTPTPPEREVGPAYIRWGKESEFATDDFRSKATGNPGFHTEDKDKPKRERLNYSETGRAWKDVRVENPNDAAQYIIVRCAVGVVLTGPNNTVATFSMTDSEIPGVVEGEGQTPPTPPLDEME